MRPMICYFIIRPPVGKERNMERMKREERGYGQKEIDRQIDRWNDSRVLDFSTKYSPPFIRITGREKRGGFNRDSTELCQKKKGGKNRSKNCQESDTYEDVIIISISSRYKYLVYCPYIYIYILEAEFLREPILESILRMLEEHRDKQAPSRRRGNFFEVFTSSLERNESFEAKISIRLNSRWIKPL